MSAHFVLSGQEPEVMELKCLLQLGLMERDYFEKSVIQIIWGLSQSFALGTLILIFPHRLQS